MRYERLVSIGLIAGVQTSQGILTNGADDFGTCRTDGIADDAAVANKSWIVSKVLLDDLLDLQFKRVIIASWNFDCIRNFTINDFINLSGIRLRVRVQERTAFGGGREVFRT